MSPLLELVRSGQELKIIFPELAVLEGQVEAGGAWLSQLAGTFLRGRTPTLSLLEALVPRHHFPSHPHRPRIDPKLNPIQLTIKQVEAIFRTPFQALTASEEVFKAALKVKTNRVTHIRI